MTVIAGIRRTSSALGVAAVMTIGAGQAQAQLAPGQALENLFIVACNEATGALLALCNRTPGFLLSGDGQASVNPGQSLSSNASAIGRAYTQTGTVQDRLEEQRDEKAGRPTGRSAGEEADFGRLSMYFNLQGEDFDRERTNDVDNETGYDGWRGGFQLGADYRIGDNLIVGALLGYDHSEAKFDADFAGNGFNPGDNQGGTRTDSAILNIYSSYSMTENLYVDGTIGVGYTDYTLDRNFIFQDTGRNFTVNASTTGLTEGYEVNASAGIGYDFYVDALSIGPYARVTYGRSTIKEYTEEDRNNSGLNMTFEEDTSVSLTTVLGVQASYAISQDWGVLIPQARFEYEHEFENDPRTVTSSFAQSTSTGTLGLLTDDPDRNYFNVGASLLLILPNGWMPFVDAEFLLGYKQLERRRYTGGIRIEF